VRQPRRLCRGTFHNHHSSRNSCTYHNVQPQLPLAVTLFLSTSHIYSTNVHLLRMSCFTFEEHHFSLPQILASNKRKRSQKTLAEQKVLCQRHVQLFMSNGGNLKASCHNCLSCVMIRSKYYPDSDWLIIELLVTSD